MMLSTAFENPTARYLPPEPNCRLRLQASGATGRRNVASPETTNRAEAFDEKTKTLIDALQRSGHRQLRGVRPRLAGDALYLEGDVTCFYLKQLAQEAIRPYTVGLRICNDVRVAP